jgi:hypothetical protein
MNRRALLGHALGATALALGGTILSNRVILATEATAAAGLTDLGLPDVTISVDDAGFTVPPGATAGRVLLMVRNAGSKELHFFAVRVPDEVSDDQLAQDMQTESDPAWFDMTTLPMLGNPDWPAPGGQAQGVVDLVAGRWVLVDPIDGRDIAIWTVGEGGSQTMGPEPQAGVAVGLSEMAFSGLDQPLNSGSQVWKISNQGALEHELAILPAETGTTVESFTAQLSDALQSGDTSFWKPVGGQGIASKGVTSWQFFDLQPGTYAAVCMTPSEGDSPDDFVPHALMGMVKIFTVE